MSLNGKYYILDKHWDLYQVELKHLKAKLKLKDKQIKGLKETIRCTKVDLNCAENNLKAIIRRIK